MDEQRSRNDQHLTLPARQRARGQAALAREISVRDGLVLLHPFDDPAIVAGQAGAGLEALEQLAEAGAVADTVLCPVGGGGLIGGVALAFHHAGRAQVWAAEPEGYNGMGASLAAGQVTRVTSGRPTICDALQATQPGQAPFAAAQAAGVRGVSVSDDEVRAAMRFAFERLKLVLEPSGAVALAAALAGRVDLKDRVAVVYATGGNIAWEAFRAVMDSAG